MKLKKEELNDADILNNYFKKYGNGYNHYTLGGFFGWRKSLDTEYTIIDKTLILTMNTKKFGKCFLLPIGENIDSAIKWIVQYINNNNLKLKFFHISKSEITILDKYFDYSIINFEGGGDYIYDYKSLKTLAGRKLHGQKNHLNYFVKTYFKNEIFDIDKENKDEIKQFIEENIDKQKYEKNYIYKNEIQYNKEVLDNLDIYKYNGILVKYDSEIIGFILGEQIKNTVFLHIMKINKTYRGIAQFLISKYLERFKDDIKYVNMEDDAGDEDLKYTKLCYHPVVKEDVNFVEVLKEK